MTYSIPLSTAQSEVEIKKSRFIGLAKQINSREAAMNWLDEIKAKYPDARHHCWAYIIGNPKCATSAAMSDDGEPSGTAGKSIMNLLQHKNVGDTMLIVVRYFGGIKLGAGGLTRAYSQTAQMVMSLLPIQTLVPIKSLSIQCNYADEQKIRHWLAHHQGAVIAVEYLSSLTIHITLPEVEYQGFLNQVQSLKKIALSNR